MVAITRGFQGNLTGPAGVLPPSTNPIQELFRGPVDLRPRTPLSRPLAKPLEILSNEESTGAAQDGEVTVVIAERIADNPGIQGFAGGVPGPILPSDRSVMVLSAIDNGGGDLQFSTEETRLLAETMAHEVGHFLGLFHVVEDQRFGGPRVVDPIADTTEDATEARENLMHFLAAGEALTDGQASLLRGAHLIQEAP